MKKKRSMFLSEYVINQYPIEKFKEIIFITLDIVENFLLVLENGFNYNSSTISSYEEKYGSSSQNNSKIESILISNLKSQDSMKNFLNGYFVAYKSLSQEEREIFDATFIDRLTDLDIISKYNTYSKHICTVRKSAIVRFCLSAGLDKFVDII